MNAYLDHLYRSESGRILATLIRLLGGFDLAEEALHEAMREALEQWPLRGIPDNPVSWLISVGRYRGIDRLRHHSRSNTSLDSLVQLPESCFIPAQEDHLMESVADDHLRLIFVCCHPSLPAESRVALTLREICGLTTEEIARAFFSSPSATAQRIVRAKNKIREDRLPYEVPSVSELPARLSSVLQVIYLVFNEGYSATAGDQLIRADLSAEAIRLGRLMLELLPDPEVKGLLALMLLQESRRSSRSTSEGKMILLEEQDRSLWDGLLIKEGLTLVKAALGSGLVGSYALQAAIAAVHTKAPTFAATDWDELVGWYDRLLRLQPSPVVALNRAVAVAKRDGPVAGLLLVEELQQGGKLHDYHCLYSVKADLCRSMGKLDEAKIAYRQALALTRQGPEQRFLEKRLQELG